MPDDRYYWKGEYSFRPVTEPDLLLLAHHRNQYETWANLTSPLPVLLHRQKKWLEEMGSSYLYFIGTWQKKDVGVLRLTDIDWVNRNAAVGLDIFEDFRGGGHAKPLFALLCDYCFSQLGMNRLWLMVMDGNDRARSVYEWAGFKVEGRMRSHLFRDGAFVDYIIMGILKEEWDDSAIQGIYEREHRR